MLKQRVITAIVLLAVLLPALFSDSATPFCLVTLPMIAAAGWEWGRLNHCQPSISIGLGVLLGGVLAACWWWLGLDTPMPRLWQVLTVVWLLLAAVLLKNGVSGWSNVPRPLRIWLGWCLIGCAWWALAQARQLGISALLSILTLVWMADIAAYFGGKALGKRKLAPQISPGKSWEGAIAGGVGVLFLCAGWLVFISPSETSPSLYSTLWSLGALPALMLLVLLVGMSVAGDLIESLVKRSAGVKDSSRLLPGHGGVLDRVDALLPVLPIGMMVMTF